MDVVGWIKMNFVLVVVKIAFFKYWIDGKKVFQMREKAKSQTMKLNLVEYLIHICEIG